MNTMPASLSQKIRQGTVRLHHKLPPRGTPLQTLLEDGVLIEDSTFRKEVAPESDPLEWRALSCRAFNSYLVVIAGQTYWGSPQTTQWAIQNLEQSRPAFPHLDDI